MIAARFLSYPARILNVSTRRGWLLNVEFKTIAIVIALLSIQAQAFCRVDVGASATPTSDFNVNVDGTVTHNPTGLMWKQCHEGLSGSACATGSATTVSWPAALSLATSSAFAGHTDWRLPNRKELESLIDDTCTSPAINATVFPGSVASYTRTGSTVAAEPSTAWVVFFTNGSSNIHLKSSGSDGAVRLVRGGQTFDGPLAGPPILNIDDSNSATQYAAATDGVLLMRYLFGLRGSALTAGALGDAPQRSAAQIETHIAANLLSFDVDNDTQVLPTTDGLMILRRLLGLSGAALTAGAKNSVRSDVDIAAAIDALRR